MFLSPNMVKDYLHVDDYCTAVVACCESPLWGSDFNVAAETPHTARQIVQMISHVTGDDVESRLKWHPNTDYLGNHRLSSMKVRSMVDWTPKFGSLQTGIVHIWSGVKEMRHNPLVHLDTAKQRGLDLLSHF
jgi:nucleoside-diphosphate-sugar epimerase